MPSVDDLIKQKLKLYDLDDFLKEVQKIQRNVFKESIDFYIEEWAKTQNLSVAEKSSLAATAVNRYEKRIYDAIGKNFDYQSKIRSYLGDFGLIDEINEKIHAQQNDIDIRKIVRAANKNKRELISQTAKGVVGEISDEKLVSNLTGQGMRDQFTKPVKRMIYQNLMTGTPGSKVKTILHDYIIGKKDEIGQLERWTGQITRDALSQYDGAINDMVRVEFDLNAFQYIGSLVKDSRPQCERWVIQKNGVLLYSEIEKELAWARSNGQGLIPGTNKDNFATYRGGYSCRHCAIPFRYEENQNQIE